MRRLIFIASWQNNDIDDLISQASSSSSSKSLINTLVVVGIGENNDTNINLQYNSVTCGLETSKSPIKLIYDCQVEYLPYSVEIIDDNVNIQSGSKLTQLNSALEYIDTNDCFAKAIDAYNNFDLCLASKWYVDMQQNGLIITIRYLGSIVCF